MIRGDSHTVEIIAMMDFHQPPSCETNKKLQSISSRTFFKKTTIY
jgi:hypothetical protein